MASNIKGIIVEIGGDTSGLQKALSKVNSASSSLSKELRGINSLLKLDPKNTELVAQKQTLLAQNINETSEKLKILKQTQKEADDAIKNGTKISDENYRNLQREIINTEEKLKNLKVEASKWTTAGREIEEYGNKIKSLGNKIDDIGNKLTTRLTLPVATGFTLMTKYAIENETAIQQVNKIYGESAQVIKDFAENTAIAFNMSSSDAYKYAQIYGNLIQSITDDQAENAKYTQQLLEASSIIASATGRTMEDVMDRIRSGLLGNTEAIEDLGVNVNVALLETTDAFKKFAGDKSWNKLDFQTQQQIRLFGILEQTTKKYGKEINKNTASSIQQLTAKTKNLTTDLGKKLLPIANDLLEKANELIDKFGDLSDEEQQNIIKIGLMVAAAGPLLKILGTGVNVIGQVTKGVGLVTQAVGVARSNATSTIPAVNNLATAFKALTSPVGIAATIITSAVAIIVSQIKKAEEETREKFTSMGEAANDFYSGIQEAEGYLETFNSTLFTSTEEQENLKKQMDEIQDSITQICKTASDERRDYTQEEIMQLDEYFEKLRELKNREIAIQQEIAGAITQQAITNATTFQGSLDEYKAQSQEWIATAQQQAESTVNLIEQASIEEVALLNQRYGNQANMQNEAYATEYNNLMIQKQKKIDAANSEVAEILSIYSNEYATRADQDGDFYEHVKHYNWEQEQEESRHNEAITSIKNNEWIAERDRLLAISQENDKFQKNQKKIWEKMYKNMSESEIQQLGSWIAMLANTEMYGGEISEENQRMINSILNSYEEMPDKTREAMKNAMSPMLDEMKKSEPTLYAKATNIANGILTRLKEAFDIHSPSRETRSIFRNVVKGAELGLDDEEKRLMTEMDKLINNMKLKLSSLDPETGLIKQSVIDKTKTIFTTPNIIINAQDELTPTKINSIIDAVNRRLGSRY